VIKIVSLPHQDAPGYYEFGVTHDGTAVLIPLILGTKQTWTVSPDALQQAVRVLLEAGLAEVDTAGVTIGSDIPVLGVKIDARKISPPRSETRRDGWEADSLCRATDEVKVILGINEVLRRVKDEWDAMTPRPPGDSRLSR
jgi:hypothetical protein